MGEMDSESKQETPPGSSPVLNTHLANQMPPTVSHLGNSIFNTDKPLPPLKSDDEQKNGKVMKKVMSGKTKNAEFTGIGQIVNGNADFVDGTNGKSDPRELKDQKKLSFMGQDSLYGQKYHHESYENSHNHQNHPNYDHRDQHDQQNLQNRQIHHPKTHQNTQNTQNLQHSNIARKPPITDESALLSSSPKSANIASYSTLDPNRNSHIPQRQSKDTLLREIHREFHKLQLDQLLSGKSVFDLIEYCIQLFEDLAAATESSKGIKDYIRAYLIFNYFVNTVIMHHFNGFAQFMESSRTDFVIYLNLYNFFRSDDIITPEKFNVDLSNLRDWITQYLNDRNLLSFDVVLLFKWLDDYVAYMSSKEQEMVTEDVLSPQDTGELPVLEYYQNNGKLSELSELNSPQDTGDDYLDRLRISTAEDIELNNTSGKDYQDKNFTDDLEKFGSMYPELDISRLKISNDASPSNKPRNLLKTSPALTAESTDIIGTPYPTSFYAFDNSHAVDPGRDTNVSNRRDDHESSSSPQFCAVVPSSDLLDLPDLLDFSSDQCLQIKGTSNDHKESFQNTSDTNTFSNGVYKRPPIPTLNAVLKNTRPSQQVPTTRPVQTSRQKQRPQSMVLTREGQVEWTEGQHASQLYLNSNGSWQDQSSYQNSRSQLALMQSSNGQGLTYSMPLQQVMQYQGMQPIYQLQVQSMPTQQYSTQYPMNYQVNQYPTQQCPMQQYPLQQHPLQQQPMQQHPFQQHPIYQHQIHQHPSHVSHHRLNQIPAQNYPIEFHRGDPRLLNMYGAPKSNQLKGNKSREYGVCGLQNLGNTCYINLIVQVFSGIPQFLHILRVCCKRSKAGRLSRALTSLLKSFETEGERILQPYNFLETLSVLKPEFKIRIEQQDAQELLLFMLDKLHEENSQSPEREGEEYLKQWKIDISATDRDAYLNWYNSLIEREKRSCINDMVQGHLQSKLRCNTCSYESITYSLFTVLSLPIPPSSSTTVDLTDCLRYYTKDEVLWGENAWECPKCKKSKAAETGKKEENVMDVVFQPKKKFLGISVQPSKPKAKPKASKDSKASKAGDSKKASDGPLTIAIKSLLFIKLPPVLFIHLSRFSMERGMDKLEVEITYPLQLTFCKDGHTILYNLVGIVNHFGSLKSGHYTALVNKALQRKEGSKDLLRDPFWCYFNDSQVKLKVSHGRSDGKGSLVDTSRAVYLLCYHRY